MSMSVVVVGVVLLVVPRWHRWVAVASAVSSAGGFATAFEIGSVLPVVSGVVVVAAVCAGVVAVLVVWEGVQEVVSFVPASVSV